VSYQGHGIATRLIGALIDESTQNGQGLVLDVLTVNHRASAQDSPSNRAVTGNVAGHFPSLSWRCGD
jgi:hypothetical protein